MRGRDGDPPLLPCWCIKMRREKGYCLHHVLDLDYLFPILTANEWGNKKRPVPTASTAGIYLSVINIENALVLKVPWHLHLVNCFQEGMLEFGGPMGQCFSRCLTVSHRSRGKGGK